MNVAGLKQRRRLAFVRSHTATAPSCSTFTQPKVPQVKTVWCWAAVTLSLLRGFGADLASLGIGAADPLCDVVMKVLPRCGATCQDANCLMTKNIFDVLKTFPMSFTPIGFSTSEIGTAIAVKDPVVVSVFLNGADTHAMILHTFCAASQMVAFMDPGPDFDEQLRDFQLVHPSRTFRVARPPETLPEQPLPAAAAPPAGGVETVEPANADAIVMARLPAIFEAAQRPDLLEALRAGTIHIGPGLPLRSWRSPDVLAGSFDPEFLGWRHLIYAGDTAALAVDLSMSVASWLSRRPVSAAQSPVSMKV